MISMKEAYWAERRRAEKAEAEVSLHRGYAEEARKLYLLAEAELAKFRKAEETANTLVVALRNDLVCMHQLKQKAEAERDRLQQWVHDLQAGCYINCVYCGHRYGPDDEIPATMADALKEHIEQCPKHPMSALKAELAELKLLAEERGKGLNDYADRVDRWIDEEGRLREALEKIDRCISNNRLQSPGARLFMSMLQDFARDALAGGSERETRCIVCGQIISPKNPFHTCTVCLRRDDTELRCKKEEG